MGDHPEELWKNRPLETNMREPRFLSNNSKLNNSGKSSNSNTFNWNPEAKEFVPNCNEQIANKEVEVVGSNLQNRLKIFKPPQEVSESDEAQVNGMINTDYESDLNRLKHLMRNLNSDPGQFDNLLDIIMETIYPHMGNMCAVADITQILVQEAIEHPNFRYSAAKLCWLIEQSSPEFRSELALHIQKQLDELKDLKNTTLFIAELYAQLPQSTVYGDSLIDAFKKLLNSGTSDDIKCICQALKLTGYSLEKTNKNDLDSVMNQLSLIKNSLTGSILSLLNSVIQLRQANWGHTDESANDDNFSVEDQEGYYYERQNTIIYETDGNNLTNEESDFISAHMQSNEDYGSDGSDPDELCDPEPEMDEEIREAFRDFVKANKNNSM